MIESQNNEIAVIHMVSHGDLTIGNCITARASGSEKIPSLVGAFATVADQTVGVGDRVLANHIPVKRPGNADRKHT
jgi:hypothetical protein